MINLSLKGKIAIFLVAVSILCLVFFCMGIKGLLIQSKGVIETFGVVSEVKEETVLRDNTHDTEYHVFVSYSDKNNQAYTEEISYFNDAEYVAKGFVIPIYYEKDNPHNVYGEALNDSKIVSIITGSAIIVIIFVLFIFFKNDFKEIYSAIQNAVSKSQNGFE